MYQSPGVISSYLASILLSIGSPWSLMDSKAQFPILSGEQFIQLLLEAAGSHWHSDKILACSSIGAILNPSDRHKPSNSRLFKFGPSNFRSKITTISPESLRFHTASSRYYRLDLIFSNFTNYDETELSGTVLLEFKYLHIPTREMLVLLTKLFLDWVIDIIIRTSLSHKCWICADVS